jgi:uncharacterized linocin/CFP29 family protein
MPNDPQVPWTDEQWARVNQVIQEEAARARVAATFLPLIGPLPPDTDFVRSETISYFPRPAPPPPQRIEVADRAVIQLATLQVKVDVRSAQMADPEMASVLALFRRAANVLARLEDAVVFRGLKANARGDGVEPVGGVRGLRPIWEIHGGQPTPGLFGPALFGPPPPPVPWPWPHFPAHNPPIPVSAAGDALVIAVSEAIGSLEAQGHFGPFALVLGQELFVVAQSPNKESLVLPQDRIIPFLGGGSLLRSSTLDDDKKYGGVVVALGGSPVELVVATDLSAQFVQVTDHPNFLFRVREKIVLRIKETEAIIRLYVPSPIIDRLDPDRGPTAGSSWPDPKFVVITGTHFLGATEVDFGGIRASIYKIESDKQIIVVLPPRAAGAGAVGVTVTTPGGTSDARDFTYT